MVHIQVELGASLVHTESSGVRITDRNTISHITGRHYVEF